MHLMMSGYGIRAVYMTPEEMGKHQYPRHLSLRLMVVTHALVQ